MDVVNSSHSYATGGTSVNEFWSEPKRLATTLQTENEESCSTHNMLKVCSFDILTSFTAYYVLSFLLKRYSERKGTWLLMIYMLPLGHGVSKSRSFHKWGTKFYSFGVVMGQGTGKSSTLNVRIPSWTDSSGANAFLNDADLSLPTQGNFLSVSRKWSSGDKLSLEFPISLRTEAISDDRPESASIQAILYGPYLLAGLSSGDWDLKTETKPSQLDWITAIPPSYNSQLISLQQQSSNETFVLMNSNNAITMEKMPESGTDAALQATFRFVDDGAIRPSWVAGGAGGKNQNLAVGDTEGSSMFRVVTGLDKKGTVSLESVSQKGCFLYTGVNYKAGTKIRLSCRSGLKDAAFPQATSFKLSKGLSEYHPISFVANGAKRKFLLMPLLSMRDESYTVYFNRGA
ncbi:hypothetical protein IFM89_027337 [Coptis chinensis]|uniref:Uncharacterized protein n=1 Tax=Coptis chinensis TaxID=261450 RepID=A0A835HEJ8_9MAGN|nr:hypothetical protein IFM89_027337 [Coptis chinensis]